MSKLFRLDSSDWIKGLVVAIISGFLLPIFAIIQTPDFNIANADWHGVFVLAINGALTGLVAYLSKNFLSDSEGKVLGKIG